MVQTMGGDDVYYFYVHQPSNAVHGLILAVVVLPPTSSMIQLLAVAAAMVLRYFPNLKASESPFRCGCY